MDTNSFSKQKIYDPHNRPQLHSLNHLPILVEINQFFKSCTHKIKKITMTKRTLKLVISIINTFDQVNLLYLI